MLPAAVGHDSPIIHIAWRSTLFPLTGDILYKGHPTVLYIAKSEQHDFDECS